jgi:hypothetical protein
MIEDTQFEAATPKPSKWLQLAVQYEGNGRAEFSNPKGSIEGHVQASFDEFGHLEIEMAVEKINSPERSLQFGLDEFLSGQVPVPIETGYMMNMTLDFKNPCESVEVLTPKGRLWAEGKILCWPTKIAVGSGVRTIRFRPLNTVYDVSSPESAVFWVIPLSNYISDFCFRRDELDNHPLRIFPTPKIAWGFRSMLITDSGRS